MDQIFSWICVCASYRICHRAFPEFMWQPQHFNLEFKTNGRWVLFLYQRGWLPQFKANLKKNKDKGAHFKKIRCGCIYAGIASPTEAAVISVFYALFVSLFIYKSIKVKEIWGIMVEAMKTYAPILFILAASTAFSRVLTLMQVPQTVSAWILAHFTNEIVLLIVINVFLLIVGMVMDTTPAILILSPILLPIVQSIGMNPIHFGVVMIVNLAIGFVTPPIGVNLFVASSLTDVPVMRIAKKAAPMIGYFLLALLILTFVPAISLCLL